MPDQPPHDRGGSLGGDGFASSHHGPKRTWKLVRLLIGILALAALFVATDPAAIMARIRSIELRWVAAALAVQALGKLIWALRWAAVLKLLGIAAKLTRLLSGLLVGLFFGNVLPTSFGGDVVRAYFIVDDPALFRRSLFGVAIERFVGFACLGWVAAPALLLMMARPSSVDMTWLAPVLVVLSASILLLHPSIFRALTSWVPPDGRVGRVQRGAAEILDRLKTARVTRWKVYLLSVGVHLVGVAFYLTVGEGLGLPLEPWHYLVIVPVTTIATAFPLSFNGLGVREGTLVVLADAIGTGITGAEAVALGLAVFAINFIVSLLGGLAYLLDGRVVNLSSELASTRPPAEGHS